MELTTSQILVEALQLSMPHMEDWQRGHVWQWARQVLSEQRPLTSLQLGTLWSIADTYLDPALVAACREQQRRGE